MKNKARNQSHDKSPNERAHLVPAVEPSDRLTKSGRVTLEDVEEVIKKSNAKVSQPRPKVTK